MRKFVIALLLAGATASPAFAQDHDNGRWHRDQQQQQQGDRGQAHQERQQQREQARSERFNGGNFARQQQTAPQQVAPQQVEQSRQRWNGNRGGFTSQTQQAEQYRQRWNGNRSGGFTGQQAQPAQQAEQYRQRWNRNNWSGQSSDYRQRQTVQQQSQYRDRTRWSGSNWNRDWRNDRRYDWRRYRDSHRSIFRLGVYFDPFGYGYRSFNIGYRLQPLYFGQQYWIDPQMYSLPYPPPGTQWVRYWNDALLVDIYSGEVVDVIHNFFW